jgi:hypothetical protein
MANQYSTNYAERLPLLQKYSKSHPSLTKTELAQLILKNHPEVFPTETAARSFAYKNLHQVSKETSEEEPEALVKRYEHKTQSASQRSADQKVIKQLLTERLLLQKQLEASLAIRDGIASKKLNIIPSSDHDEATPVILASDWHYEERVDPRKVNGKNAFDLQEANLRIERFFNYALKLIKKEQQNVRITKCVLALLGDFISGNIHEELLENCLLPPIEAMIAVQNQIASGIQFLLDNSDLNFIIPCHVGNHTRITKKIHISTEQGNSLETFAYHSIANHFKNNPRIDVRISEAYTSYIEVYDFYTIRFHHGHAIKYGGGVGGITIPVKKALAQFQKQGVAQLDCFGHFHQFMDGGDFICNGSLIGHNAYAEFGKFDFQRPMQTFFLIDKKRRCKTVVVPIILDV